MSHNAAVSGVIVNYRTPELTARAARSLLDDGVDEVVVVENGSGDGSITTLDSLLGDDDRVTLVESHENLGFGRGVNLGAASSTGAHLFLLNSDAVVQPGCTIALLAALEADPALALAAPLVEAPDGRTQVDAHGVFPSLRSLALRTNRHPPDVEDPDWVSGAAVLIRRSDFDDIEGFDPRFFMYFEDIDLCRRLRKRSRRVGRVRTTVVQHDHQASRESDRRFLKQYYEAQDLYFRAAGWPAWQRQSARLLRWPTRVARSLRAMWR